MVVEDMEIDEYSRDRSRSPARRDRSRSPERGDRSPRGGDRRRGGGAGRGRRYSNSGSRYPGGSSGGYRDRDSRYRNTPGDDANKADRNHTHTIFVGNLPFNCQWYQLKDHFKSVGDIVRADIVTARGRSKGMGTVEFRTKEDVDRAINEFDQTEFLTRKIFVREDHPPPSDSRAAAPPRRRFEERDERSRRFENERRPGSSAAPVSEGCEIFIGNLPFRTNWQELKDLFRNVGSVVRADVRTDATGRSKGFGTVIFENKEDALRAIEEYNQYELDGRRIDVREGKVFAPRQPPPPREPVKRNSEFAEGVTGDGQAPSEVIFANNLPFATANEDLFDLFETIGKVENAEIKYLPDGRSAGSAVIKFTSIDDAAAAIEKLNNYEYGNRPLQLSYAVYPSDAAPVAVEEEAVADTSVAMDADVDVDVDVDAAASDAIVDAETEAKDESVPAPVPAGEDAPIAE